MDASIRSIAAIVDASDDAIIGKTLAGTITSWNAAAERLFAYTAVEIIGQSDERLLSPEGVAERLSTTERLVRGEHVRAYETCQLTKNRTVVAVSIGPFAVRDDAGVVVGIGEIVRDITEQKQAEATLRSSALLLQQATLDVERRNEALARANAEALAAARAKSAFLASVSHEIRTPMNAIIGMADLLAESTLQPHQEDYVRRLGRASASLLDLVNDVLDLSKIEADQIVIESAPFDLHALLDDVGELLAIRVLEKRLEFVVFVHPDVPQFVRGDQTRLRQVLVNLAGNAVKFTKRGEVAVRVEPVVDAQGCSRLAFSVADTGIGIPADKLAGIFESFTQVDVSTTRKYGGTGLGLSISKRFVELMSGRLEVTSAPGCGSTFRFALALEPVDTPASARLVAADSFRGRPILVVDDHESGRLAVDAFLAREGCHVVMASDAESATAAFDEAQSQGEPVAVALIDQDLRGTSGIALANALRARPHGAALPIVFYVAEARRSTDDALRHLGIADQITKPITRRRLMMALSRALNGDESVERHAIINSLPAVTPIGLTPLRILVVEDSEENREVIAIFLKDGRYQVDVAENGAVGVERFLEDRYDVVLMDMQMPIMDGYQATIAIRQWERERGQPETPIIALTANAFPEDVDLALGAGCTAHMAKPVRKATLIKAISDLTTPESNQAA